MEFLKGLSLIAKAMNAPFTLKGRVLDDSEVFSEDGLLPAIAKRADQLCTLCLGYGIGISFEEVEPSTLGIRVIFDDATPVSLRYLFILDVFTELKQKSSKGNEIPLDNLI
jgi:intracellular multiplication protein IcmS